MSSCARISFDDLCFVSRVLGRQPKGLRDISVRNAQGDPMVIQVASLIEHKPFPTLYWLIDPKLCYEIDRAEAQGLLSVLQQEVNGCENLQQALHKDHCDHIKHRDDLMTGNERDRIQELGFSELFSTRGIGGISNYHRIRCFHTFYAAHLIQSNTVGLWLENYWQSNSIDRL